MIIKAVYWIPSKPQPVESAVVRHSTWLKSVKESVRPGIGGDFSRAPMLQSTFRRRADQIVLRCGGLTAQDLRQTRFGKIASPFGHGLPAVRREQDVLIPLCESGFLH
jgi:hypothetical protein